MLEKFQFSENMKKFIRNKNSLHERYSHKNYANWQYLDFYFLFDISPEIFVQPEEKWRKILEKKLKDRLFDFHPDSRNGSTEKYFALMNAYDVLCNNFWRKKYNNFFIERINFAEEDIKNLCEKELFIIFNYLFLEEGKFYRTKKEIIEFGARDSSIEHVKNFYNFWEKYETNRSFDFLAYEKENDKNLAEQYNEKLDSTKIMRDNAFALHMKYVRTLIFYAKKYDPRIKKSTVNIYAKFICDKFSENDLKKLKMVAEKNIKNGRINWLFVMKQFKLENGKKVVLKELVNKYNQIKK